MGRYLFSFNVSASDIKTVIVCSDFNVDQYTLFTRIIECQVPNTLR